MFSHNEHRAKEIKLLKIIFTKERQISSVFLNYYYYTRLLYISMLELQIYVTASYWFYCWLDKFKPLIRIYAIAKCCYFPRSSHLYIFFNEICGKAFFPSFASSFRSSVG
jgi:hypothetical protein